jgi:hypothetical protein
VFLLLVVQFRSLRLPAAMFLRYRSANGLYALLLTGVALNISSAWA